MTGYRSAIAAVGVAGVVVGCAIAGLAQTPQRLPLAPLGRSGNAVFPALEGWFRNADGTTTFFIGYYNRNEVALDIPIGPNNHIDPGGPDMGQPTFFLPRRQYGVFGVTVPRDFGSKRLTWTLNANGQPQTIPLWINPPYVIDPFRNAASGNTPPRVTFDPGGVETVAVPRGIARTYEGRLGAPVELTLWVSDDDTTVGVNASGGQSGAARGVVSGGPARGTAGGVTGRGTVPARVTWSKYRGTGDVTFEPPDPPVHAGKATTRAAFSAPGEYWLRSQVNDASGDGGGGAQCCWTNAHVKILVK